MPGVLTVYAWELRKLVHQKRTFLGLAAGAGGAADLRHGADAAGRLAERRRLRQVRPRVGPRDPAGAAAVRVDLAVSAGDGPGGGRHHRGRDHNGTLKTIFTRSLDRGHIFAGKALAALTYAAAALFLMGSVAVVAGT